MIEFSYNDFERVMTKADTLPETISDSQIESDCIINIYDDRMTFESKNLGFIVTIRESDADEAFGCEWSEIQEAFRKIIYIMKNLDKYY